MIDIEAIFQYKSPDPEKLIHNGFKLCGDTYKKSFPIMCKQFCMIVTVEKNGAVNFKVYDADTNEEYVLVHVENAAGGFVGDMRDACGKVLTDISNKCFNVENFRAEQTKRILSYIKTRYDIEPGFLWDKYPNDAAFRKKENKKWFAIIMAVDKSKIGISGHGDIEIIDLKDSPENVERRLDGKNYFKAYHMNKKHWYTICLDGSVADEKLMELIDTSYKCVK